MKTLIYGIALLGCLHTGGTARADEGAPANDLTLVSPTDLAIRLPATNWRGERYRVEISRKYNGEKENRLLQRAEATYPAKSVVVAAAKAKRIKLSEVERDANFLWWLGEFDGVRTPYAITTGAVIYYRQKIREFRGGDFRATRGLKMFSASLKYVSCIEHAAKFTQGKLVFRNVYVARMELQWDQVCGNLCAMGFDRKRIVIMKADGAVLSVIGDEKGSVIVS